MICSIAHRLAQEHRGEGWRPPAPGSTASPHRRRPGAGCRRRRSLSPTRSTPARIATQAIRCRACAGKRGPVAASTSPPNTSAAASITTVDEVIVSSVASTRLPGHDVDRDHRRRHPCHHAATAASPLPKVSVVFTRRYHRQAASASPSPRKATPISATRNGYRYSSKATSPADVKRNALKSTSTGPRSRPRLISAGALRRSAGRPASAGD